MILFNCPRCGHGLNVPAKYAGMQGKCSSCGNVVTAPRREPPVPVPIEPPALPTHTRSAFGRSVAGGNAKLLGRKLIVMVIVGLTLPVILVMMNRQPLESSLSTGAHGTYSTPQIAPLDKLISKRRITLAKFNQIRGGMSYIEVCLILDKSGTVLSERYLMGTHMETYTWENGNLGDGEIVATFKDDRLISKTQFGLE